MSLISKTANVNDLVAEMQAALEDQDFRNVFERPVIRTASDEGLEKKASAPSASDLFETILATSAHLDELGLSKTAEQLLVAAQGLSVEAMEKANEEEKEDKEDKDDAKDMAVRPGQKAKTQDKKVDEEKAKEQDKKPKEGKPGQLSSGK